jgi:hypothetical protein
MEGDMTTPRRKRPMALLVAALTACAVLTALPAIAGTSSGNLPGGTPIEVSIDNPVTSTDFLVPPGQATIDVFVEGHASIGEGTPVKTTGLVYVIDGSGSTTLHGGPNCGEQQTTDPSSVANQVIDCEILAVKNLNAAAVAQGSIGEVGMVGFGAGAESADLSPGGGDTPIIDPAIDSQPNGIPDVDEVAQSIWASPPGKFDVFTDKSWGTYNTNFEAAAAEACNLAAAMTMDNQIVIFLSDGMAGSGNVSNVIPCGDVVFHTIAVGSGASCGSGSSGSPGTLQYIADHTGGTCTEVADPNTLPDLLPGFVQSELLGLHYHIDGPPTSQLPNSNIDPDLPVIGPANVDYWFVAAGLGVGDHEICVTAEGLDNGGSDVVTRCETIHLLQPTLEPPFESNELGEDNTHTVTATVLGDPSQVAGYLFDFTIDGQNAGTTGVCDPADCRTDANGEVTFTYEVPVEPDSLGLDTITAAVDIGTSGFESGDLSGWYTQIPIGGSASATTSHSTYEPKGGDYFALLKTDGPGLFTSIAQPVYAAAGDTISGWAFFDTGDYLPYNDQAEVRIWSGNTLLDTVFYADTAMVGDYGQTPWTRWEYVVPSDGHYTVEARITNSLDSIYDSFMGLDAATVLTVEKEWIDTTPPECETELVPIQVTETQGEFFVSYECTDDVWPEVMIEADINGVPVFDGQSVDLIIYYDGQVVQEMLGGWIIWALDFLLTVRGEDGSGNVGWAYAEPVFENTYPSIGPPNADVMPPNLPPPGAPPVTEWPPPPQPVTLTPLLAAPEDCTVELTKLYGYWNQGTFRIDASCIVDVETMTLDLNGYEVADGDLVELVKTWGSERAYNMFGMWRIEAPEFLLTLTTTGPDGTWTTVPDF